MSDESRGDSDPLPYLRVDRTATPLSSALATWMSVTQQHALGSLTNFWNHCAEPRALERLVAEGKKDLVLDGERFLLLFEIASGKKVPMEVLLALGIAAVTEVPGHYRVRGMSRNIEPIAKRVKHRETSVLAGKRSVEVRRQATGSAQPVRRPFEPPPNDPSNERSEPPNDTSNGTSNDPRTAAEPRGQRSEASKNLAGEQPPAASKPGAEHFKRLAKDKAPTDPRHAPLRLRLLHAFLEIRKAPYAFEGVDGKKISELLPLGTDDEIVRRWREALTGEFPTVSTLAEFKKAWNHYAGDGPKPNGSPPRPALRKAKPPEEQYPDGDPRPSKAVAN